MRRFVATAMVAGLLLASMASAAGASAEWCEDDPAVTVTTPDGQSVVVYVTDYALGTEHLDALKRAEIRVDAERGKQGEQGERGEQGQDAHGNERGQDAHQHGQRARVAIKVRIPNDKHAEHFRTRSVVSTLPDGHGVVLDATEGHSGQEMTLRFTLPLP